MSIASKVTFWYHPRYLLIDTLIFLRHTPPDDMVFTAHWSTQAQTDMKRIATRPAPFSLLLILFLASMLAFTACDSSSVVGPDDASQDIETVSGKQINDPPSGGSTDPSDGHNTGCPMGDPEC